MKKLSGDADNNSQPDVAEENLAIHIQLVKDSLELFESRRQRLRERFYQMLFNENPQLAAEFDEAEKVVFREIIDRALAAILTQWQAPDQLEATLTELGRRYRCSYLKTEYCSIYREVMVASLEEVLGPDLPEGALAAWDEIIGFGMTTVQRAWSGIPISTSPDLT